HFIEQDNIDLIGVVLPKEEYDLINSYLNGDISKEEYTARKKDLAFRKYSECGNCPKRIFYKDKNVFSEQVVLIDVDEINTMNNPDKEFLLTVTEESAHSLQDFIEI